MFECLCACVCDDIGREENLYRNNDLQTSKWGRKGARRRFVCTWGKNKPTKKIKPQKQQIYLKVADQHL